MIITVGGPWALLCYLADRLEAETAPDGARQRPGAFDVDALWRRWRQAAERATGERLTRALVAEAVAAWQSMTAMDRDGKLGYER